MEKVIQQAVVGRGGPRQGGPLPTNSYTAGGVVRGGGGGRKRGGGSRGLEGLEETLAKLAKVVFEDEILLAGMKDRCS